MDTVEVWHISSSCRSRHQFPRQRSVVQFETPQSTVLLANRCDNEPVRDVRTPAVAAGDWAGYLKASKIDTYLGATHVQPRCIE